MEILHANVSSNLLHEDVFKVAILRQALCKRSLLYWVPYRARIDIYYCMVQAQGASPRHTRQVTVRASPTAAPAAAAFPGLPRSDGPAPNQAPQMRAAPQGQGVREAELSRDDIVAGARESARLHAPHGEEVRLHQFL